MSESGLTPDFVLTLKKDLHVLSGSKHVGQLIPKGTQIIAFPYQEDVGIIETLEQNGLSGQTYIVAICAEVRIANTPWYRTTVETLNASL